MMGYVDISKEKRATELYIKALLQDLVNSGLTIADIQIETGIDPETHRRKITDVKVLSDVEVTGAAFA